MALGIIRAIAALVGIIHGIAKELIAIDIKI